MSSSTSSSEPPQAAPAAVRWAGFVRAFAVTAAVALIGALTLAFLLDPANHLREGREWKGLYRTYYAMPFGDRYIWGATAGMIRNLYERLAG